MKFLEEELFVLKMLVIKFNDLVNIVVEETCAKYNVNRNEAKVDFVGIRTDKRVYEKLMIKEQCSNERDFGGMCVKFQFITMIMKDIMKNLMNVKWVATPHSI
ncbi:polysaccharide biosynthesis protein [Clostridium botulinum]|uniref:polysaccharide biosynthesis protein n=1 Tax=Clostridium botulinum TaxID=1491 RepID=UPI00099CD3FF|nr:polysaccharide biosynthesis protein [Clostridium botulinum]